jgi:chorismate-pyruvate lyase
MVKAGAPSTDHFKNVLCGIDENVNVTVESPDEAENLPHLDLLFNCHFVGGSRFLKWSLFKKPMASPHVVHYWSAHSEKVKSSYISGEVLRTLRNCKLAEDAEGDIVDLAIRCRMAEYPPEFIMKHIEVGRTRWAGVLAQVERTRDSEDPRPLYRSREYRLRHRKKKMMIGTEQRPYVMWIPARTKTFKQRIQRCFDRYDIPVLVREVAGQTVRKLLCKSTISDPPVCKRNNCVACGDSQDVKRRRLCAKSDMIYEVECLICKEEGRSSKYCGQTERPLGERIKEHHSYACLGANHEEIAPGDQEAWEKLNKHALARHYYDKHRGLDPRLDFRMVKKTFGHMHRDTLEATLVRRREEYNLNLRLEDNGIRL